VFRQLVEALSLRKDFIARSPPGESTEKQIGFTPPKPEIPVAVE
jgi:hypothetical protein